MQNHQYFARFIKVFRTLQKVKISWCGELFSWYLHAEVTRNSFFPDFLLKNQENSETRTSKPYLGTVVFSKMSIEFSPHAKNAEIHEISWFLVKTAPFSQKNSWFLWKCDFSSPCAPGLIKPMRNGCFLGDSGVKSCILAKKCIISRKKWLFHEKSTFSRKNMIWARSTSVHSQKA